MSTTDREVAAFFARVERFLEDLVARPGLRDAEGLQAAARTVSSEIFNLVSPEGKVARLLRRVADVSASALVSGNVSSKVVRRVENLWHKAECANRQHMRALGVAWLEACRCGTDGDRRTMLLAIGVDLPGNAFTGESWLAAVRAVGLDPDRAARDTALALILELDIEMRPTDEEALADVIAALARRAKVRGPASAALH